MTLRTLCRLLLTPGITPAEASLQAGMVYNTATRYREILDERRLTWADLDPLTDDGIDRLLNTTRAAQAHRFAEPDWSYVHAESGRKGMTVSLLYAEYVDLYQENLMSEREFRRRLDRYGESLRYSMRQAHAPGERMCVDYAGDRPTIFDIEANAPKKVELFVSVVGVSQRIYVQATPSQELAYWIDAHVNAFEYYGHASTYLVPDNLKSAVTKVDRRAGPTINASYLAMGDHYGVIILPTRPGKPKDKASVENAVRYVQRCVRALLRRKTFYSLAEFNAELRQLSDRINSKPVRHFQNRSRNDVFAEKDVPAMHPLPATPYEFAEWKVRVRVPIDYHVEFDGNHYSVPHVHANKRVDIRARRNAVEIYEASRQIATHPRADGSGHVVTNPSHQTTNHRAYSESGYSEFRKWAESVGPGASAYVEQLLQRATGAAAANAFRGMKTMSRRFGMARLEAACARAVALGAISASHLQSMLIRNMENHPLPEPEQPAPVRSHENVRGSSDYGGGQPPEPAEPASAGVAA